MNIDIIKPFNRLDISSSSSKVSSLHFAHSKLYVGYYNGDLSVHLAGNGQANRKIQRSLNPQKSFNEVKGLFNDNNHSQLFSLESKFSNVTENGSSIDSISVLPLANDSSKTILAIGSAGVLRIVEAVGRRIHTIMMFDEAKSYVGYEYLSDQQKFIIAAKKKVLVYDVVQKSRNITHFNKIKELSLKDKVKAIGIIPNQEILIASVYDFVLLDIETFGLKSLPVDESSLYNFNHSTSFSYFGISYSGPQTQIINISSNKTLLIKDTQVVSLITKDGSPCIIEQSPIKFSTIPIRISFIKPLYLVLIYPKKIDIIDIKTGDLIQRFHQQINSNSIFTTIDSDNFIMGSGTDILIFKVLDLKNQIHQYLSIRGAGSHSKNTIDPKNDLRLIGLEKAISLVSLENDKEEDQKNKLLYIRTFYITKAKILFESYSKYHESLVDISSEWLIPYDEILPLFPDFLNGEKYNPNDAMTINSVDSGRSISPNIVKRILVSDIEGNKHNNSTDSGTENEANSKISTPSSPSSKPQQQMNLQHKSQHMRKFSKALNNLIVYLTDQRRIHANFLDNRDLEWKGVKVNPVDIYPILENAQDKKQLNSQLRQIATTIDTSLFLCYYYMKPMLLGPLLRLPNNNCNARIVNECLLSDLHKHTDQLQNFLKELLDFYFGRKLHKDALEMLYKLAHEEKKDDHEFDRFIGGVDLTIQYLNKLGNEHLDLIFKFAHWVITEETDDIKHGELLFMNDLYECESYNNTKVLDYFISVIKSDELAIRYLEWLLFESDVFDGKQHLKFYTRLCLLYLKKLKEGADKWYPKLYNFLETSTSYEPWTVLKNIPTSEDRYLRLTIFIYKRLGEHDKSIDVLFNQLDDLDAAMTYCSDIYYQPHNKTTGENLLHKLMEDLLIHYDENLDKIEKLLILQGSKMSILRILTSLPNSFPMNKLSIFLQANLRNIQELLHDSRLAQQLYKVGSQKTRHKLLTKQSEGYPVQNARQLCGICNKKLGYTVLSIDKNNQVVHYGCFQRERAGTDPRRKSHT
ncbi:vacuolar carboxypeptidase Y [Hyphopichia burtonii NRRL Y-1933]|uniref:Vacuolar carboxypeptidase Y n=1 Tax=Hyphopichia burtonii NRRL Y-1933 TaxID=984485 RepID=A0A1E4RTA4_9ASCO|nr:vacuolar carboxypeptidase Y [Hyphopichia burtonii NRRL Y-1933]ODV70524.1 vacuolar carboxypeptidase Y [Hyphopichia burtonii NRRL Y-1933]